MKPFALPTGKMAEYIGYSPDTLKKLLKKGIFEKGIHYTIPPGCKHPRWIVEKMEEWVLSQEEISPKGQEVLKHIIS